MSTELHDKLHDTAAQPSTAVDLEAIGAGIRRRRGRRVGAIAGGVGLGVIVAAFVAGGLAPRTPTIDPIGPGASEPITEVPRASESPTSASDDRVQVLLDERVAARQAVDQGRLELLEAETEEAELIRREQEGDDVTQELQQVRDQIEALSAEIRDAANRLFAIEVQLVELGALDDPVARARAAATDADRALVEAVLAFAGDIGAWETLRPLLAAEVALGAGDEILQVVDVQTLSEPASWRIDPGPFRGREGPISFLDVLQPSRVTQTLVGEHPHCASAPMPAPAGYQTHRRVSVQPVDGTSCLQWWTVDFFVNDDGLVEAVTLDLWEP